MVVEVELSVVETLDLGLQPAQQPRIGRHRADRRVGRHLDDRWVDQRHGGTAPAAQTVALATAQPGVSTLVWKTVPPRAVSSVLSAVTM